MKILSIQLLLKSKQDDKDANILCGSHELSSFGYFQRGSVKEFLHFTSKLVTKRTNCNVRQQIADQQKKYNIYCQVRSNFVSCVIITDLEYPQRVAFSLMQKILMDFESNNFINLDQKSEYELQDTFGTKYLDPLLEKYQDPTKEDDLLKIKQDLEETKTIVHQALESILERGEKLDNLVEQSNDLSTSSKYFYNTAAANNSCCNY